MRSWKMWLGAGAVGAVALMAALNVDAIRWSLGAPYYHSLYRDVADPVDRARMVDALGRRGVIAYTPLLEEAARDTDPRVRIYAQQHLSRQPWRNDIVRAQEELSALTCEERFTRQHFFPRYRGDVVGGYVFGTDYWDQPGRCVTTPADWAAYLDTHAHFVWVDDARWFAAPVFYQAGDLDGALSVLDDAMRSEHSSAEWTFWAVLRYFVVEKASAADVERWLAQGDWHPSTEYALTYARGLHAFRALQFEAAATAWESLPEELDVPTAVSAYYPMGEPHQYTRRQVGHPRERAIIARRLAGARDLPVALLIEQIASDRGLFEAWLFADHDLNYTVADVIAPLLTDSPRDRMLLAQAHHVELGIASTTSWRETALDETHAAAARELYAQIAAEDVPYAAQAEFLAGIFSRPHIPELQTFAHTEPRWAAHAAFWAEHVDHWGDTRWAYLPYAPLDNVPPSLELFGLAQPVAPN